MSNVCLQPEKKHFNNNDPQKTKIYRRFFSKKTKKIPKSPSAQCQSTIELFFLLSQYIDDLPNCTVVDGGGSILNDDKLSKRNEKNTFIIQKTKNKEHDSLIFGPLAICVVDVH
uniref:Uncharacterized protein LOC113796532 n=1 Tax=Dermatophagoides pteronyssinus TaxID=6956 RepID=A0A6P6YB75_DERPT|nr:uncharacterized protein LOC113796532 [Dermatophagoides pteronyssinus]